ncbi:PadR family transcriptional regulator [Aquisalimonas asiatica]|uniref:Transcriptional regulator PadR-like family protein n=1 Tax=Aquisalimonas asiatica TaxID=406100 RepID=A0A1H8RIF8_9GAMM|nr:PadR family transcriptional regulator [Aquisalimonas asiatica]SEO65783.1 Transcriptional regulator PadR-like family protein [Aquisalimonas asiatica]
MALRYALLAALHEEPATGYDLNQRFGRRQGFVWSASHQQIYRELGRLHEEGLLSMEAEPQAERPDRKRYAVTPAGEAALRDWLATPQPRPATRDPLLVKLFAGDLVDDEALRGELATLRRAWEERLAAYREVEATWFSDPETLSRHYRLQYLALRRGITAGQAWLHWLDEAEALLQDA